MSNILTFLQGFIAAISPFNFTAIGVNLAGSPAMGGNVVLWKPSDTAMLSGWLVYKILQESGLPDGMSFPPFLTLFNLLS